MPVRKATSLDHASESRRCTQPDQTAKSYQGVALHKFKFQKPSSEDRESSTYSLRVSRSSPCIALKMSVTTLSDVAELTNRAPTMARCMVRQVDVLVLVNVEEGETTTPVTRRASRPAAGRRSVIHTDFSGPPRRRAY